MATFSPQPAQVVMTSPPAPGIALQSPVITQPASPHPASRHRAAFLTVGRIQLSNAFLCFVIGGVSTSSSITNVLLRSYTYGGIWGGIFLLVSGALAIAAGSSPSSGTVVSGMVLAIISAITSLIAGILEALTANTRIVCISYYCSSFTVFIALHAALAFLLFVGMILSIVHAAYCCSGCRGSASTTTLTVVANPQAPVQYYPQQQVPYYGQQIQQQPQQVFPPQPMEKQPQLPSS